MATPENVILQSEPEKAVCDCCCDSFNKTVKAKVTCPNNECNFNMCKECVRTYLLSTTEAPHCMNCKAAWNERFLVENLNTSFVNKQYKAHRKNLLAERQISMLPETMPALERHQFRVEYEEKQNVLRDKISELKNQINHIREELSVNHQNYYNDLNNPTQSTKRKFILPCPDENCRGYLSSAYKCEVCKYYACPKCLVLTGRERTDDSHVCDPDLVETAKVIRETTKPCPSCGERIMKASGCDQMWCTSCHTAFSWRTGQIDTGIIHNPHFFQYRARGQGAGAGIRNPGDIVCGGLPNNWWQIRNRLRQILMGKEMQKENTVCSCKQHVCDLYHDNNQTDMGGEFNIKERSYHSDLIHKFSELFQFLRHLNGYELPQYRRNATALNENEDLRIQYLLKNITRNEMATTLMKRDKKRRKIIEITHLYELITAVGNDLINHITEFITAHMNTQAAYFVICAELTKKFTEFDTFVDYVNNEFKIISVTYNQTVCQIVKSDYTQRNKKFKVSDLETSA